MVLFAVYLMDDKPSIVAVTGNQSLRSYYRDFAGTLGISCSAFERGEEALPYLAGAKLLIVHSGGLPLARDFAGSKILITSGVEYEREDYVRLGVDEVWQGPDIPTLQGLMRKYTSDKPRALVLEDDPGVDKFLKNVLNDMGHDVELFSNADEAVSSIPSVHYVISDITQPKGMGGYGLLKEVRKIYDSSQLPFILISGTSIHPELVPPAAQAFLKKPFNVERLEAVVNRVLSNTKSLKPLK